MLRNIGAVIIGLIVGGIWNMGLIILNVRVLFPMEEGADMNDPEQMKAHIASMPALAFVTVIAAHVGQAGIGGWIAARFGKSHPELLAWIVGGLTAFGAAYNQVVLDGPAWMWIDVLLILFVTWFVGRAESRRRAAQS